MFCHFVYVWLVWNNADVEINFIIQFYLSIIYWTIVDYHMCLYHLQDKTKNLKRVYLIQTNKKQIQGQQKTQHNMCCTPLYTNKQIKQHNTITICVVHHYTHTNKTKNTTQYVLECILFTLLLFNHWLILIKKLIISTKLTIPLDSRHQTPNKWNETIPTLFFP
jgi:hypothetical protein